MLIFFLYYWDSALLVSDSIGDSWVRTYGHLMILFEYYYFFWDLWDFLSNIDFPEHYLSSQVLFTFPDTICSPKYCWLSQALSTLPSNISFPESYLFFRVLLIFLNTIGSLECNRFYRALTTFLSTICSLRSSSPNTWYRGHTWWSIWNILVPPNV